MSRVRYRVKGASVAPPTTSMRIRTRIACSFPDVVVLVSLGKHFDRLQGADLSTRCRSGADHDKTVWAGRKQHLTEECSSRFAGAITKSSNNAYMLARRNQRRALGDKEKAIAAISEKLKLPVRTASERKVLLAREVELAKMGNRTRRKLSFGYRSPHEHAMKRARLQHLNAEVDGLRADIEAGVVHITRGGKRLASNRLHFEKAGITQGEWRHRWAAKRWSFGANGETGKRYGNESIRLSPNGTIEVDLPRALASMANVKTRGVTRYRFDAKVTFSYRQSDWLAQVEADRAVAYDVVFDPSGKVYLDASFTPAETPATVNFEELKGDPSLRVLGVDLNHGFLAPAVLDSSGNPIMALSHIALVTEDLPASTRDGHLRHAITTLCDLAVDNRCAAIVVEHLGFDEMRSTGREKYGSCKWFRKVVCGIPTAKFRDRLVAMAGRKGVAVLGVPAAYSSIWGAAYWQAPLSSEHHKVSRHTAAAVVLGRRALGHSARRRPQASPGMTADDQRIEEVVALENADITASAESYHVGRAGSPRDRHHASTKSPRRKGNPMGSKTRSGEVRLRGARPAKTVRAGSSAVDQLRLMNADV